MPNPHPRRFSENWPPGFLRPENRRFSFSRKPPEHGLPRPAKPVPCRRGARPRRIVQRAAQEAAISDQVLLLQTVWKDLCFEFVTQEGEGFATLKAPARTVVFEDTPIQRGRDGC